MTSFAASGPARQHLRRPRIVAALDAREHVGMFRLELGLLAGVDAKIEQVLGARVVEVLPIADPRRAARTRAPEERALAHRALAAQRRHETLAVERIARV